MLPKRRVKNRLKSCGDHVFDSSKSPIDFRCWENTYFRKKTFGFSKYSISTNSGELLFPVYCFIVFGNHPTLAIFYLIGLISMVHPRRFRILTYFSNLILPLWFSIFSVFLEKQFIHLWRFHLSEWLSWNSFSHEF